MATNFVFVCVCVCVCVCVHMSEREREGERERIVKTMKLSMKSIFCYTWKGPVYDPWIHRPLDLSTFGSIDPSIHLTLDPSNLGSVNMDPYFTYCTCLLVVSINDAKYACNYCTWAECPSVWVLLNCPRFYYSMHCTFHFPELYSTQHSAPSESCVSLWPRKLSAAAKRE